MLHVSNRFSNVTLLAKPFSEEEEYIFNLKITKDRLAELKV